MHDGASTCFRTGNFLAQHSTKPRNIVVFVIIGVLVFSSVTTLIVFYPPSTVKSTPTGVFDLNVSSNQTNVLQGDSSQVAVNVAISGSAESISLGYQVGSSAIVCSFTPAMGKSNFTSTLAMNVLDSTPTGNYSLIITASSDEETKNASLVVSVLSANVTVSGTANISFVAGVGVSALSRIQFVDAQTGQSVSYDFPFSYPPVTANDVGAYSVTLQNEHTYNVTLYYYWGMPGANIPESTYAAGNFTVFAPAGDVSVSQNFSLG